ncbi:uncharacterized protein LOC114916450 [Cajanus cajan]|uniref:uncharacterized protein LOC114916450 n=1 Tax=Cajanus cajan TaxID=3821 RepID=UPI0010FB5DCB|nr:uncharacterized protein LOC114916450 [Cajanus cajan]
MSPGDYRQKFPPCEVPGYDWVDGEVAAYFSRFHERAAVIRLLSLCTLGRWEGWDPYPIMLRRCRAEGPGELDLVFLAKREEQGDFFYMYECFFRELGMSLPFDDFQMGVLRVLNVAPTQLHPNAWAYMQAFRVLCKYHYVEPTVGLFLHFFCTRPSNKTIKWLSLIRNPDRPLLTPFTSSFKGFKSGFVKVIIDPVAGRNYFYDADGKPLFPFYWTHQPRKYDDFPEDMMTDAELSALSVLKGLPRCIPSRFLVLLPKSPRPRFELEGWMAQQGLGLSYRQLMRSRAPAGSSAEDHRSVAIDSQPQVMEAPQPAPPVIALPDPKSKRRKDKGKRRTDAAGPEAPRPKQRRVEGSSSDLAVPSAIVAKDFLSEEIRPSRMMSSDLLSAQGHTMLDSASPSARWAMACELHVRATAIFRKMALEPMGDLHNLQKSLEDTKAALQQSLSAQEALSNDQAASDAEIARLKGAFAEMEARALAAEEARVREAKEAAAREEEMKAEADTVMAAFRAECEDKIVKEHEEGFWHAVRQATHFGAFPSDFSFELSKDFFQGEFLDFAEAPDDLEPDNAAPPRSASAEDPGTTLNSEDDETEQTTNAD